MGFIYHQIGNQMVITINNWQMQYDDINDDSLCAHLMIVKWCNHQNKQFFANQNKRKNHEHQAG